MNPAAAPRAVTQVAVGVLLRDDGRVLLADRPAGKPYAGYWEFPGGKIEPGEAVEQALERELHEELGVDIGPSAPWVTFEFDYPHAFVRLQFRQVRQWRGEPHAREGQRLCFVDPAGELPQPLLPAAVPALRWLRLPHEAVVVGLQAGVAAAARRAGAARMVVIDADWQVAANRGLATAWCHGASGRSPWLLACGPQAMRAEGVDGFVLESASLARGQTDSRGWRGAWADSAHDLHMAAMHGCDFVLLRSPGLADSLRAEATPLPVFVPGFAGREAEGEPTGHGRWIDLRDTTAAEAASALR
jgi:8-oxo-dGTP diphosphatase